MMILRFAGLSEEKVQEFRRIVKTQGRGGPPDAFMGLRKFGFQDKVYLGYSKNYNQQFHNFYKRFLSQPDKQIINFSDSNEALKTLKNLISSNIPVVVLIQRGNHYAVVTGYDENYIYLNI